MPLSEFVQYDEETPLSEFVQYDEEIHAGKIILYCNVLFIINFLFIIIIIWIIYYKLRKFSYFFNTRLWNILNFPLP
jgi:hypothetical protein